MQTFPLTVLGLNQLAAELRRLKTAERPAAIQAIADARTQGEISENAEYFAAREYQSFVEGRIAEIEEIIASADVIDPATLSGDHVVFGAWVCLLDDDNKNESQFQIVGVHEADILPPDPALSEGPPVQPSLALGSVRRGAKAATASDTLLPIVPVARFTPAAGRERAAHCTPREAGPALSAILTNRSASE